MPMEQPPMEPEQPQGPGDEEIASNVAGVMQEYGVDEQTALTALAAEMQGYPIEDIIATLQKFSQQGQPQEVQA